MTFKIRVEGLRECEAALAELPKATGRNVLRRIGRGSLEPMRNHAASIAPDNPETGAPDLRTSLATVEQRTAKARFRKGQFRSARSTGVAFRMGVPRRVFYGLFQEYGTVKMAANPFMRPANDAGAQAVVDYIADNLKAEIGKATARLARKRAKARG